MKTLLVLFLIILSSSESILFSQQNINQIILSPFIGEKLDCVEESYFNLFSGVTSFNKATFYLDADSSLFINIKFYEENLLIDTLIISIHTPQYLQNKINEVILKDIKEGRVEELEFITKNKEEFEGTVYSFENEQIKLIEDGFDKVNDNKKQDDYISLLNYSKIEKIKIYRSSTTVGLIVSIIGAVGGWFIGGALAPEPKPGEWDFSGIGAAFLGATIGSLAGYLFGNAIQVPAGYDALDSETKSIIKRNSLLPSGL